MNSLLFKLTVFVSFLFSTYSFSSELEEKSQTNKISKEVYENNVKESTSFINELIGDLAKEIKEKKLEKQTVYDFLHTQEKLCPRFLSVIEKPKVYDKITKCDILLIKESPDIVLYIPDDMIPNFEKLIDYKIQNPDLSINSGNWFQGKNGEMDHENTKGEKKCSTFHIFIQQKTDLPLLLGPF